MKFFRIVCAALLLLGFFASHDVSARDGKDEKVYVFGYGQSYKDSTVFLTPITEFPFSEIDKKTKFMPHQAEYAKQMEQFLRTLGFPFSTCVLFYDKSRDKLQKRLTKLREHIIKDEKFGIQDLSSEQFSFSLIETPNSSAQP